MASFMTENEIAAIGFAHVGQGVQISRLASFHNPGRIRIGDRSRIDDFCVLSAGEGGIEIGRNVHIAVMSTLIGKGRITVSDFANISSRVAVYSSNDDYSGEHMTNPTVPAAYTNITNGPVHIGRHVIIGSGSVVTLNVTIGEGVAVGALSLVRSDCEPFGIYVGSPARRVKERSRRLLELEQQLLQSERQ
ncbi:acyltransferase [Massilia endophytica]|uniref:acyltransferase n=1 Tax=Massilia endophytica TaxID=2899220 RepID=UPI001E2E32C6|nr:acyltransferase [Massilia endophytica]UGQ47640.1 acyltransferase [Massilia endophytica]